MGASFPQHPEPSPVPKSGRLSRHRRRLGRSTLVATFLAVVMICSACLFAGTGAQAASNASTLSPSSPPDFRAVSCPTKAACMAVGPSVFRTTDGGTTWMRLSYPKGAGTIFGVACASVTTCEVDGVGNGDIGAIYGTTDGGAKWTLQLQAIVGGYFLAIACPSTSVCEATGLDGDIFGTTNGGATWTPQLQDGAEGQIVGVVCEAVAGGGLRTTNGGQTWKGQGLPEPGDGTEYTAVSCGSTKTCAVIGFNSFDHGEKERASAARTTDGGADWYLGHLPSGTGSLSGVACTSLEICEAVGTGNGLPISVVGTTDGGKTWVAQDVPASASLNAVACPTADICEAVGTSLYRTVNGGNTWIRQHLP